MYSFNVCRYSCGVLAVRLVHFSGVLSFCFVLVLALFPPSGFAPPWAAFGVPLAPLGLACWLGPCRGLASPCVSWAWVPLWGPCCSFPPGAVCGSVPGIMLLHVLGDETFCACRPMWLKPRSAPVNGSGARLRSPPSFHCLLSQFIFCCFIFSHVRNHGSGFIC